MHVRIDSNAPAIAAAFDKAPLLAQAGLRKGMARGALELARAMGREQPKATSQMRNATGVEQIDADTWHVGTSMHYGRYTDQGSGPGGWVPDAAMDEWLGLANLSPHDPAMTDADLRYVIQRKIYRDGTPAQPWREPALKQMTPRISQLAHAAVAEAMQRAVV